MYAFHMEDSENLILFFLHMHDFVESRKGWQTPSLSVIHSCSLFNFNDKIILLFYLSTQAILET